MKNTVKKALALLLCLCLLCTAAFFSVPVCAKEKSTAEQWAKTAFDKFVNVLIDVIHRGIVLVRYPWEPKEAHTIDLSGFTLVFEDSFEGSVLDERCWSHYHPGIRKGGYWDEAQTVLRDGCLVIRSEYLPDGKYGAGYYTDRIDTRRKYLQTYGYFECRCILPAAQGLWSAFWLSSENIANGVPGTQGTEIDVFESPLYYRGIYGLENGLVTSNLHYGGYELGHRYRNVTVAKAQSPYSQFNTYGLEWNENEYIFYINGIETGRSSFGGVSKVPEYMLLSTEFDGVGGQPFYGWSGIATRNRDELPAEFIVDYVRAYQYTDRVE